MFGDEFGIEATSGKWIKKDDAEKRGLEYSHERTSRAGNILVRKSHGDGLHIHIHALLFVRRVRQSRNLLHREILLEWNKLTENTRSERTEFTSAHRAAIKKGNTHITDTDIDRMKPKGATFISLETIYTLDKRTGEKIRGGNEFNSDAMRKAVMETISYHFEPLAFEKEDKTIDIELLVELLPKLRNTKLYQKFGCLDGEKSLNVSENGVSVVEDLKEVIEAGIIVNEETGEIMPEHEYFIAILRLFIINPNRMTK